MALFLTLNTLQSSSTDQLLALSIDPYLISSVPDCFLRYTIFLLAAATAFCLFLLNESERPIYRHWSAARSALFYGALAFFLAYLVLTRTLQLPLCVDDSYIDFRYIFNWLSGTSFDYNPGDRCMGFTSHLHIAVLTLIAWVLKTLDLTLVSQCTNIVLGILSYFLIFVLIRRATEKPWLAAASAAVYALFPYNTQETMAGKETLFISTLMLASLLFMQRKNLFAVAWCAALILATRPEGGLWMLLSMVWMWLVIKQQWRSKSDSSDQSGGENAAVLGVLVKVWIGPFLLLAGLAAWLFANFGTIVPHSLIGKSNMFYKPFPMMDMVLVLRRLGDGALVPDLNFFIHPLLSDAFDFLRLYGGSVYLIASLRFVREPVLRFYAWVVFAYFLLYSIVNPYLFPWYYCWFSLVPPIMVPLFCYKLFRFARKSRGRANKVIGMSICFYLIFVQVIEQPVRYMSGLPAICFYWSGLFDRLMVYKNAAETVASAPGNQAQKLVVASPEVGVLGWFYHGPILDLGGLVTDKVIRYAPPLQKYRKTTSLYAVIPKIIVDMRPDYLVTDGSFCENGLFKEDFFKQTYLKDKFYPLQIWSEGFYLFKREPGHQPIGSAK